MAGSSVCPLSGIRACSTLTRNSGATGKSPAEDSVSTGPISTKTSAPKASCEAHQHPGHTFPRRREQVSCADPHHRAHRHLRMAHVPPRSHRAPLRRPLDDQAHRQNHRPLRQSETDVPRQKDRNRDQRTSPRPRRQFHKASEAGRLKVHLRHRQPQPKRRPLLLLLPNGPEVRTDRRGYVRGEGEVTTILK